MNVDDNAVDVLIVGAGPVGLFLACECARRGLRFRIVEQHAGQSEHSKALAIFPRTLEIFDMAGIAAPFLAAANRATTITLATPRRRLARIAFAPRGTPYPYIAMVPQDVSERLLVDVLHARGAAVEYLTTCVGLEQAGDGVRVTLDRAGARETLTAACVVGCDGAHSTVRKALGLPFEGGEYAEHFLLADVETNAALPADAMQLCPNAAGPLAVFPMNARRRRIVAMVAQPEGDAPSLALVQRLLRERAPPGLEARALHWSGYFQIHHRCVTRLREGRVFLAGDAAHIHSPFGGQGMNTGLQDAWNLAWKLDLWLHGLAGEALLDSYGSERIPVITGVIATTDFLTRTLGTPNRLAEFLRNLVIPVASRLPPVRRALVARLSELGIAYRGSPIVAGGGRRCRDDWMRNGGVLRRYVLRLGETAATGVADAAGAFVAARADVLELRRVPGRSIALVRPDGYVACAAKTAGAAALARLGDLLDRQAGRA